MRGATTPVYPWSERRHDEERPRQAEQPFHVDRDRIIHAGTFRELQHKTQVQSVRYAGSDRPFRTRLNHVLEVAQIARGIAAELGASEELAEGIALAHDLGHTPFGHAGERALSKALVEYGHADGFNANVHSLAVVDEIELAFPDFRGLNLTWATREGIARHATPFDEPVSFGEFMQWPSAGLEAQIVDLADPLGYISHDLDDAITAGLIELDQLASMHPFDELVEYSGPEGVWPPEDLAIVMRRRIVARLIARMIGDIVETTRARIESGGIETANDVRESTERTVLQSEQYARTTTETLHYLKTCYYKTPEVQQSDQEAVDIVTGLFAALVERPDRVPERFVGSDDGMRAATYIASLNDLSARELAVELGVINSDSPLATAPS